VNSAGQAQTQVYTTPHWGNVIPFALTSGSALRPGPPATYPSQAYTDQAAEIIAISAGLNDVQKVTAEYFADGPSSEFPPGHWAIFAQFVSRRDAHSLDDDVKMFFALSNALLDASVCPWDAKRFYDSERPGTAIHFLFAGQMIVAWGGPFQGTRSIRGEDWQPYQLSTVRTPPFPEYFSGHSVFSAAGAEILKSFTGSDTFGDSVTIKARSSIGEPGVVPTNDCHALVADLLRRRRCGWNVTPLRGNPFRARRPHGPRPRPPDRSDGLGQGEDVLRRNGPPRRDDPRGSSAPACSDAHSLIVSISSRSPSFRSTCRPSRSC
jgi:hypothetical protein